MPLFTDGPISSIEDLRGHDTQLLEVANMEHIDVTRKLAQAQEEVAIDLAVMLSRITLPARIANVVVTPPLKLWHTFRSLEKVYRDAFNSQLNDRYAGKRDEYHEMAKWAHERVMQSGVGMTADPIPQAPTPTVQAAPGGVANGTYYVSTAWTNARGEEGASSIPATIMVAGSSFEVLHGAAPGNAKGWHVYVGSSPQGLLRQDGAVLALGVAWRQTDTLAAGRLAGTGQAVGFVQAVPRLMHRG